MNLAVSTRTIQKYLNRLGWRKIGTKYCQFVSYKNRIERIIYAELCLTSEHTFPCSVFIDESLILANKNANRRWHKPGTDGETRLGLVGRYSHLYSVHLIGGISRLGKTELVFFQGIFFL